MAVFAYKAMDGDMALVNGTIVADTPREARDLLRGRGLDIQEVQGVVARTQLRWWQRRTMARHTAKLADFIHDLSTLLAVGTPLLEALDTIAKQHKGRFATSILMMRDRVAQGMSLAEAMRLQPAVFDELCVHMTEVGENAGTLETVLEQMAEFRQRAVQLKGRVGSAMIYPCIVLLTGIGVSLFLMTHVVPTLFDALLDAGKPLPASTRIVKTISDTLIQQWWLLGLIGVAIFALIGLALSTSVGRMAWHRMQLRIPILGVMIRKQTVGRVALVIATLMRSGMVFERAIQIAQRSTTNLVLRDALQRCESAVQAGQDIGDALGQTRVFSPLEVQVFSIGQHSGRLEEMLERLSVSYDRQVALAAGRLTAVLEPVLIILLAVIVGFIAMATILPILEAGNVF